MLAMGSQRQDPYWEQGLEITILAKVPVKFSLLVREPVDRAGFGPSLLHKHN